MKTKEILMIHCLALLGIALIASLFKKVPGIVKNGSFFIAIVLLAVSQVLDETGNLELEDGESQLESQVLDVQENQGPPRCSGRNETPGSCVFGVCDTNDSNYVRIFNPNNTDDENYKWCIDPCANFPDGMGCKNTSVKGKSLADTLQDQVKNVGIESKVQSDGQYPWFKCVGKGSNELNNRGGLVTNLKTDLYGKEYSKLDLCDIYGYSGYSGCFSRFDTYQDVSEYGCPYCPDASCSNICKPGVTGCCTWADGPTKCNSGTCAKWGDNNNTYCCPTKSWTNGSFPDWHGYCINLSSGDPCKYSNQCLSNKCESNKCS